jgi:hypothetical protein
VQADELGRVRRQPRKNDDDDRPDYSPAGTASNTGERSMKEVRGEESEYGQSSAMPAASSPTTGG